MKIEEKVELFLKKHKQTKGCLLVAFSGGWDSMCLLDIIKKTSLKYGFTPIAIHLNHNWRGEESQKEEENCKKFCTQKEIEFYCETLSDSVPKTETAARDARYKFFETCAKKFNSKCVLTAHNFTDNAETVIYRIAKGTGIVGLQGINEKRGIFYRPLLNVSRDEIETYCKENNLCPNCDSSNDNPKYKRNYIRHKIMPMLKDINKFADKALNSLSDIAYNDNKIIEEYLEKIKSEIFDKDKIKTKQFINLSYPVKSRIVREISISNNIDYDRKKIDNVLKFIEENKNSKSGKTYSLSDFSWIFVSENYIDIISATKKGDFSIDIYEEGIYETPEHVFSIKKFTEETVDFPRDEDNRAFVELDIPINFQLRNRKDGDKICPMGLGGCMKLKKYLISKGVPKHKREGLLFLCSKDEILWAPSLGLSEKIKVVNKPTHVLKLVNREGDYED